MNSKRGKTENGMESVDFSFQVDLKGMIRLLSENLYSSSDVFVRELLQNAVDAIEARREMEPAFGEGRISIEYRQEKDQQAELMFRDNGIGLSREEIHSFLSVIGQSSKREEVRRSSFIGQFGIGLLSCFLVTDEIAVKSRSVREEQGYRWIGKSDGTYQVTEEAQLPEPGTQVMIRLRGNTASRYGEERVIQLLKNYGFLIRTPVEFSGDWGKRRINDGFIPWRHPSCSHEQIMEFGELMFHESFFGMVPISQEGLKGYVFISERQTSAAAEGRHKIFLKDMLVTENGRGLVPKWAFFTRCILNAENLTPMASREGFVSDHRLLKARHMIEKCMFDYFKALAQYDVNKLKHLTMIHNTAVKSLAVENEQIYKLFFPFLTFSTNKGHLTGFQLVEAAKTEAVYYCVEVDDYRRACPLAGNGSSVLVNAGYIYDAKLLQLLRQYHRGIRIAVFDEASYGDILEEPSEETKKEMTSLHAAAERALNRCSAVLKQFDPPKVPALYVTGTDGFGDGTSPEGGFSEFLEGFDFEDLFGDSFGGYSAKLYLNVRNPLVRRLAQVQDGAMMETMIQILYVQAMLAGHYPLGERETEILNTGLMRLVEYGLGGQI
ncbi:MAG: HSP90 family protein [Hungatella sp.]|nr:HSP90 family protein [Hungatella sp.]